LAVDAVNRPGEFMVGKKLLLQGVAVDKTRLSDETIPAKQLLET
jgi:3-phenylpropionate/trans-cinnamate dioxygenase ferredoxin reductase subunit